MKYPADKSATKNIIIIKAIALFGPVFTTRSFAVSCRFITGGVFRG